MYDSAMPVLLLKRNITAVYSEEQDANSYGTKNITVSSLSMCSYKMVQFVS